MKTTQRQSSLHRSDSPRSNSLKKRFVAFFIVVTIIAAAFIISGTVIWVLNIVGVVPGPLASIFGAVFTSVGVLVELLNCLLILLSLRDAQGE